jgi:hypothetical protein
MCQKKGNWKGTLQSFENSSWSTYPQILPQFLLLNSILPCMHLQGQKA